MQACAVGGLGCIPEAPRVKLGNEAVDEKEVPKAKPLQKGAELQI